MAQDLESEKILCRNLENSVEFPVLDDSFQALSISLALESKIYEFWD